MKYHKGQKVQDKRDNIRGTICDSFDCSKPKYSIENKNGVYEFYESELEPVLEARLFEFILRTCRFIKSDWTVSAIIFGFGFLGGLLL